MNIFVIHSSADAKSVDNLELKHPELHVLRLPDNLDEWENDAAKLIKTSNLVLVIVGEKTHESPYIDWEIKKAIHYKKQLNIILLDKSFKIPEALYYIDTSSKAKKLIAPIVDMDYPIKTVNRFFSGDYDLFNTIDGADNNSLLLEQYKMFLQSSENLVERRQKVSNFYITVNSAMLAVFGVASAITKNVYISCGVGIAISLVGIVLCLSWIRILQSYGILNSSKMKIISAIEKKLPASIYDAEWKAQCDILNNKKYISFTASEIKIPKIFIGMYILLALAVITIIILTIFKVI